MSRTVELPDAVYAALEQIAAANGTTAADWIAVHVPGVGPSQAEKAAKQDWLDRDFLKNYAQEADDSVSLDDVRQALAKIPGRLADDIRKERDEN
jgi:glucan phosphorylase